MTRHGAVLRAKPWATGAAGAAPLRAAAPLPAVPAGPVVDLMRSVLPRRGLVLEVSTGAVDDIASLACAFPHLLWQPARSDPLALRAIEEALADAALFNLLSPLSLDLHATEWPVVHADAIVLGDAADFELDPGALMRSAARLLPHGAPLCLDGRRREANAFRALPLGRNPGWSLRDIEAIVVEAELSGLGLDVLVPMPDERISVIFRKA